MYGNLERALRLAGCTQNALWNEQALGQSLTGIWPEITADELRSLWEILERSSFAREEPSSQDQNQVWRMHCTLVKKAFAAVPVRRRLWFRIRVYGG